MNVNIKNKIYFLGDSHFGAQVPKVEKYKSQKFINFINSIKDNAAELYLVGDIFDFWFEFFNTIPNRFFPILKTLADLVECGTQVHFLGGNHDLWGGPYLRDQVGLMLDNSPLKTIIKGKRFLIAHGDGVLKRNWHYRYFTRPLLNSKLATFTFKLIHPDLGCLLARVVSDSSRLYSRKRYINIEKAYTSFALKQLETSFDYVILGHLHEPTLIKANNGAYLNVGNWFYDFSYGVFENGELRLQYF